MAVIAPIGQWWRTWFPTSARGGRIPYFEVHADSLMKSLPPGADRTALERELATQSKEYRDGRMLQADFMLAVKSIEYRALRLLNLDTSQLRWFVGYDLSQTTAPDKEILAFSQSFLGDAVTPPTAVTAPLMLQVESLALIHWRRYADTLSKAVRRERTISAFLALALSAYVGLLFLFGSTILFSGQGVHWQQFVGWLTDTKDFRYILLGLFGATVSIGLDKRDLVDSRPLDGTLITWSLVPRLLMGAIAGIFAPVVYAALVPLVSPKAAQLQPVVTDANQATIALLAFAAGFTDRLFFTRVSENVMKIGGLGS